MRKKDTEEFSRKITNIDPLLWLIPLMLSGLGILMITSTTSPLSFELTGTPFAIGLRQLLWLAISIVSMLVAYSLSSSSWKKISGLMWCIAFVLVVASAIPGVGTSVGGARRWLRFAGLSLQPAELLVFAVAIHLSSMMTRDDSVRVDKERIFLKTLLFLSVSAVPLFFQPDLGSIILLFSLGMGIYVERFGWKYPLFTGFIGNFLLGMLVIQKTYRMRRVMAFIDPWKDPLDTGFQAIQGLIAFANGGAWGTGLGHGLQKLQYLPAAYTDFIYAALGEELGLLGTLGVLFLFLFWVLRCRYLYNRTEDDFKATLIWAITLTIIIPLFINIAGVTKAIPLTGMPLPFVSFGGTSLVVMWMRVGILLHLSKQLAESTSSHE